MDARRGLFADFSLATAVLTRIPVSFPEHLLPLPEGAVAASSWAFPLVGAGVGALTAAVFFAAELLRIGDFTAALLAVLAGVLVTGAVHEDGMADTADGFGGGGDRETKLAIMRDSRQGTYGILALVFSIALRVTTLATIGDPIFAGLALLAAHTVSRGLLPAAMRLLRPARSDGLGAGAGRPSIPVAITAGVIALGFALGMLGPTRGGAAFVLCVVAIAAAGMLAHRQIGGYTGDVLGCFQQIGEIVMLLAAAAK
jgi:adenosylcobinamide-GDP ribazoletransferase